MKKGLMEFFDREKIEYFSVISYSDCHLTRPHIIEREDFLPRSVIIFAIPYYCGDCVNISCYAASRDYHIYIREITERLTSFIKSRYPYIKCKGYGDHSPIDERLAAARCGLGIIGDNGLLINERYGSYVFIAELITDAEIGLFGEFPLGIVQGCEHCGACSASCPTTRLSDLASPCLSSVTQKRGSLTDDEMALIKKTGVVWGCDVCQQACPHNKDPQQTPIAFFKEKRITKLTSQELLRMSDEEFSERAFSWRGKKTVLRNLELLENV